MFLMYQKQNEVSEQEKETLLAKSQKKLSHPLSTEDQSAAGHEVVIYSL